VVFVRSVFPATRNGKVESIQKILDNITIVSDGIYNIVYDLVLRLTAEYEKSQRFESVKGKIFLLQCNRM
jgi:hypothetical protein